MKLLQPVLQLAVMTRLYIVLSAMLKSAGLKSPFLLQDTVMVRGQLQKRQHALKMGVKKEYAVFAVIKRLKA